MSDRPALGFLSRLFGFVLILPSFAAPRVDAHTLPIDHHRSVDDSGPWRRRSGGYRVLPS